MTRTRQRVLFVISMLLLALAGYVDHLTGAQASMLLLYAVPILLSSRYCGKFEGIAVAATAASCWLLVNATHPAHGGSGFTLSWNAITRFGIFALIAYSVSLQAHLRQALEREQLRADTDRLTGLFNKGAFQDRVQEEMNEARRYGHPLSIAFIDLDNFKEVNDTWGHARGDKLLQLVSQTMLRTIRKTDLAGRIGGDEFAICFIETGAEQVRRAVDKLISSFDIMSSQSGWQVTVSIGVVTSYQVSENYDTLLGKADRLMYLAKERGENAAEFEVSDRKPE